jgi:AcrR family transcriptional regulator
MAPENTGRKRRPRTDALLNREGLLSAAKAAFAEAGAEVSLEEIARRANLGVGTAYRNFPSKEAIIEAVCRAEVERLVDAAPQLLASMPAAEALQNGCIFLSTMLLRGGAWRRSWIDDQRRLRTLQLFNTPAYASRRSACRACYR